MNRLDLLYRDIRYITDKHYMIVVTDNLVWEDIAEFTDYKNGVIYVTPSVSSDNVPCYILIIINRREHIIQCCNTRGDTMNCEAFNALCNLEDNGETFLCMQYKYATDRYDEVFAVYLAYSLCYYEDLLIHGTEFELKPRFIQTAYNYSKEEAEHVYRSDIPYEKLKRYPFEEEIKHEIAYDNEEDHEILRRHQQELRIRAQRLNDRARRGHR